MLVKIEVGIAGADYVFNAGDIVEVDDKLGKSLCEELEDNTVRATPVKKTEVDGREIRGWPADPDPAEIPEAPSAEAPPAAYANEAGEPAERPSLKGKDLKQLKAIALELGITTAEDLKAKADVVAAIESHPSWSEGE